jgi:hypothetical protein
MSDGPEDPIDEELRALPRHAEPPPELEARVLAALQAQGLIASRPRARRSWAAAAAVACVALGWAARDAAERPRGTPGGGPRYVLLLSSLPEDGAAAEARRVEEYRAWALSLRREKRLVSAEKLGDQSDVLGGGPAALDVSGVFLIRAGNIDEAVSVARECPHLRHGGTITIRSVDPT